MTNGFEKSPGPEMPPEPETPEKKESGAELASEAEPSQEKPEEQPSEKKPPEPALEQPPATAEVKVEDRDALKAKLIHLGVEKPDEYLKLHQNDIEKRILVLETQKARTDLAEAEKKFEEAPKKSKTASKKELEKDRENYKEARARYIGEKVERKLNEEMVLARARFEIGLPKDNWLVRGWRWLGEQNLTKLGWQPKTRTGRFVANFVSLRTGISFGLLGASLVVGGPASVTGLGFLAARRLTGGFGAGVGTYDFLAAASKAKEIPKFNKETGRTDESVPAGKILESMQSLQARALVEGKNVTRDPIYQQLRSDYFERINITKKDRVGIVREEALKLRADALKQDLTLRREDLEKKYTKGRKIRTGIGFFAGAVVGSGAINTAINMLKGEGISDAFKTAWGLAGERIEVVEGKERIEILQEKPDSGVEAAGGRPAIAPMPKTAAEIVPEIKAEIVAPPESYIETASKGNRSIWQMLEHQLDKRYVGFKEMGEAQKTYLTDYFKDKIVADPKAFSLTNPEILKASQKVDFSQLFEGPKNLDQLQKVGVYANHLSPEKVKAIIENNRICREWVGGHPGQQLTTQKTIEILTPDLKPPVALVEVIPGLKPPVALVEVIPGLEPPVAPVEVIPELAKNPVEMSVERLTYLANTYDPSRIIKNFGRFSLINQEEITKEFFNQAGNEVKFLIGHGAQAENYELLKGVNQTYVAMRQVFEKSMEYLYNLIEHKTGLSPEEYKLLSGKQVREVMIWQGSEYSKKALKLKNFLKTFYAGDLSKAGSQTVDRFLKSYTTAK